MSGSRSSSGTKLPIIIAAVTAAAACAAWFGRLWYISTPAYAEKHKYDYVYEMYKDDEHFVGVIDNVVWFDWDYTDIFHNQTQGGCTHDLSYTEPVIPAGKYYPNGDPSREYYMEITDENGEYFFEYKNADGTAYGPTDGSDHFYERTGKHQFKVITQHGLGDQIIITTSWTERDPETDPYPDLWLGDTIYKGSDGIVTGVSFDDDGNAVIDPIKFANSFSENAYNMTDIENGYKLTLPEQYSGYFLQTDSDSFFAVKGAADIFSENELVRIYPADDTVSFNDLKTGDMVNVSIVTIGDLSPRVMPVYSIELLHSGDISDIDRSVIARIEELGHNVQNSE